MITTIEVDITENFERKYEGLGEYLAKTFYKRLMENIESNKFGFTNKPSTIKNKGFNLPLVDSGEYKRSIQTVKNRVEVKLGMHSSGISMTELANLLEYGRRDKGFKGFPVWRLSIDQFKKDIPQLIKDYLK